jgi:hypothetical protein
MGYAFFRGEGFQHSTMVKEPCPAIRGGLCERCRRIRIRKGNSGIHKARDPRISTTLEVEIADYH